ncbi:MAG: hypothetical protein LLG09_08325 [Negativicutes bacterium]|nr:hypothetical protein [Negativicutes bacterium]
MAAQSSRNGNAQTSIYVTFIATAINLSLLIYDTYAAFLVGSWFSLLGTSGTLPTIALPIGISFYTFQDLSYLLDVRSGKADAQHNLLDWVLWPRKFWGNPPVLWSLLPPGLVYRLPVCKSTSIFSAIPTWRPVSAACLVSSFRRILITLIFLVSSRNSGGAGIFHSAPGSARLLLYPSGR